MEMHLFWTIKIENNKENKILVSYIPTKNKLIIDGMYRERIDAWVIAVRKEIDLTNIETDLFDKNIASVYDELMEKTEEIKLISEYFKEAKILEPIE
jgi:hypothetical protein